MKSAMLLILLMAPYNAFPKTVATKNWTVPVVSVHDGDTFTTEINLPEPLNVIEVRIKHIDTPELGWRSKCDKENQLAIQARARAMSLLAVGKVTLKNYEWDKYSRILSEVYVGRKSVGQILIDEGYAVAYEGEGAKKDWCN